MHTRPPAGGPRPRATVLSRVGVATGEDPFGPGDPLEVARLLRRALATAGRKAVDVTELRVVADAPVDDDALGRFARRALGPHGGSIARSVTQVAQDRQHEERIDIALETGPDPRTMTMVLVVGPHGVATAMCVAAPGSDRRSGGGRT